VLPIDEGRKRGAPRGYNGYRLQKILAGLRVFGECGEG